MDQHIIPVTPAQPAPEINDNENATENGLRSAPRHVSVILLAKLDRGESEAPCRVLNLSENGLKIETLAAIKIGDEVEIEFRSDLRVRGQIRWVQSTIAGVELYSAIDLEKILHHKPSQISRTKSRPPRYRCAATALVEAGKIISVCELVDLSTSGAKLRGVSKSSRGSMLTIEIEALPKRRAQIVWLNAGDFGVKLENPLRYDDIEGWLAKVQAESDPSKPC